MGLPSPCNCSRWLILKVSDDLANPTGFVEVELDTDKINMFAVDLRDHES